MDYPLVQVETSDGFWLHGLYLPAKNNKIIFINIHGTASNFYEEDFIEALAKELVPKGISFLSTNNRGAGVYDAWNYKGAAVEIFEECLIDINTWIEFALIQGYSDIILSGHSLGTEKVIYYMSKGKYKDKVKAIILLAPADSPKWRDYDQTYKVPVTGEAGKERVDMQLREAKKMITEGKGNEFLNRSAYGGLMPKSANSLINFLGENTELVKALPFHSGKLEFYSKIKVPILVLIGDQVEYTAIPIKDALKLMEKENKNTKAIQLKNCNHDFEECESELTKEVVSFLQSMV
jgi:alpha-beta hydrolase superfamily lysophospholipase